jgi:hypothetical protein
MLRDYAVVALKFYIICLYFDNTLPKFPCLPIFLLTQMHGLRHYAWNYAVIAIKFHIICLYYDTTSSSLFLYIYNNRVICLLIKLLKVKSIKKKKGYREMSSSLNYLFPYTNKMFLYILLKSLKINKLNKLSNKI